jgi:hypothetical protein
MYLLQVELLPQQKLEKPLKGIDMGVQFINPLTDAHKTPPLSLCYRSIGCEESKQGPLH